MATYGNNKEIHFTAKQIVSPSSYILVPGEPFAFLLHLCIEMERNRIR